MDVCVLESLLTFFLWIDDVGLVDLGDGKIAADNREYHVSALGPRVIFVAMSVTMSEMAILLLIVEVVIEGMHGSCQLSLMVNNG